MNEKEEIKNPIKDATPLIEEKIPATIKTWINDINEPTVSWDTPYFTKK